jgi:hypothetical protein
MESRGKNDRGNILNGVPLLELSGSGTGALRHLLQYSGAKWRATFGMGTMREEENNKQRLHKLHAPYSDANEGVVPLKGAKMTYFQATTKYP